MQKRKEKNPKKTKKLIYFQMTFDPRGGAGLPGQHCHPGGRPLTPDSPFQTAKHHPVGRVLCVTVLATCRASFEIWIINLQINQILIHLKMILMKDQVKEQRRIPLEVG